MPGRASRSKARGGPAGRGRSRTALVLSGGSALGAYQAGAYETLHQAGLRPEWIAGTSIGAVNAALIAGNRPDDRPARLRRFWELAATPDAPPPGRTAEPWRSWRSLASAARTLAGGQPRLFHLRLSGLFSALPGTADASGVAGLHDLGPMRRALESLADFDRINGGDVRLTVVATDIESGEEVVFDTARRRVEPAHVIASASMPPEFPPVEVEGRWLADGGLAMNTPVDAVLDDPEAGDLLCFAVDLFDPGEGVPRSLDALLERRLNLIFAGQTRRAIAGQERAMRLRRTVAELGARLPAKVRDDPEVAPLLAEGSDAAVTLVQVRHPGRPGDVALKMYDFSRTSLAERWAAGAAAMGDALRLVEHDGAAPRRPGLTVLTARG